MTGDLIYDVGFNNGDDTAFYLSQGYPVVAIDANPVLVEAGRQRFRDQIAAGKLHLLNVGIADREGHADFWVCPEQPQFSSFHKSSAARKGLSHHAIQVPTAPFDSILERHGAPHYLKLDIEGLEATCLRALSTFKGPLPRYVSAESECQADAPDRSPTEGLAVLQVLKELGYSRFKLIHQRTFCSLSTPPSFNYLVDRYSRRLLHHAAVKKHRGAYRLSRHLLVRSRLERRFQQELPQGCSGAWGEATAGAWMTYDDAHRAFEHFRTGRPKYGSDADYPLWCDWHASL